jgi:endonuclease/exonuclease/phosphatase family metal-dependent hydrolase
MTFNVRGSVFDDGENRWPKRADLNVQTIKRYAPDLIGFQELQDGHIGVYKERLTEYQNDLGLENSQRPNCNYNALYWKPDRFEMLESGGFYLSTTPDRWSEDWDTACVRAANWATMRLVQSGALLLYVNTHLDHISEWARSEGSKLIIERIRQLRGDNLPVIITGDFNTGAWDVEKQVERPVHKLYTEAGFKDTYWQVGNVPSADTNTFHGFEGKLFPRYEGRIDWILTVDGAQRFQVDSGAIILDEQPPLYPSDHYPVLAELTLI